MPQRNHRGLHENENQPPLSALSLDVVLATRKRKAPSLSDALSPMSILNSPSHSPSSSQQPARLPELFHSDWNVDLRKKKRSAPVDPSIARAFPIQIDRDGKPLKKLALGSRQRMNRRS